MMSHRMLRALLIVGCMLGLTSSASAWDGERKGFLIGLKGGVGFSSTGQTRPFVDLGLAQPRPSINPPRDFSPLVGADFLVGYAPNNNVDLFLFTNTSWFNVDHTINTTSTTSSFTLNQLTGIGLTYYKKQSFLPSAPAGFVTAGVGVSMIRPSSSAIPVRYGPGFTFGGGYEFKKHIRSEIAFGFSTAATTLTTGSSTDKFSISPWTVKLTIGVLGY